jgi:hypothetical protein
MTHSRRKQLDKTAAKLKLHFCWGVLDDVTELQ